MFTDIFGKQYKRNPNLINTNYSFTECNTLHNALCGLSYTEDEFKYLVKPVLDKLSIYDNCFLKAELEFIRKALENLGLTEYSKILSKTNKYLEEDNIEKNRRKAEL